MKVAFRPQPVSGGCDLSRRLLAPSSSTSSASPTSIAPSGSASSGAVRRAERSPELLIDCEEDRTLRAVLVGMLREAERLSAHNPPRGPRKGGTWNKWNRAGLRRTA